jgi:putative membrane protein
MRASAIQFTFSLLVFAVTANGNSQAPQTASDADKAFVAKVSQGGRYEVEASKLALQKASAQDVRDTANSEVHDHDLVNKKLKMISAAAHVSIAPALNSDFTQKLDHLKTLSGEEFDRGYMEEMAAIHDKDEKLFAQEAIDGSGEYKLFAAETDLIVRRHIGAINGRRTSLNVIVSLGCIRHYLRASTMRKARKTQSSFSKQEKMRR